MLGVLYLLRTFGIRGPGVVVAAVAYMFTPYTLDYSARISVLLLPFAALPWLIGLTRKALRDGGWRYPAIVRARRAGDRRRERDRVDLRRSRRRCCGSSYAWLVDREVDVAARAGVTARIGLLTLVTSLWWIAGLEMQGTYGLDILKYTETVRAVATASSPNEILRGLGYWFFYGGDRIGPWIESASQYTQRPVVLLAGYGLVVAELLAAGVLRWRHRLFFVALLVVGMIIAVGPSPYAASDAARRDLQGIRQELERRSCVAEHGARGSARRARARGAARPRAERRATRRCGAAGSPWIGGAMVGVVLLLVVVNLPALFDGSYYGKNLERPEAVPAYWTRRDQVPRLPGRRDAGARGAGQPTSPSYSWGNTVDPITPGLMDRPYVARELIPYGTAGTADLLNAFDRRFQERIADPAGVAALLRRMGIGAVVLAQRHPVAALQPRRAARDQSRHGTDARVSVARSASARRRRLRSRSRSRVRSRKTRSTWPRPRTSRCSTRSSCTR